MSVLVHGLGIAGLATARALIARGDSVILFDDDAAQLAAAATELDGGHVEILDTEIEAEQIMRNGDVAMYCPAPGVPESHQLFLVASQTEVEICGELELAYRWESQRPSGPRPFLAVTGTDGKTTTTMLATHMLNVGGVRACAAGNTETPLVEALALDVDCFVVECTSFRLSATSTFRAETAAWLNLAPDHLDWHTSLETYIAAKARIFEQQSGSDTAIGYLDDPIVAEHLGLAPGRHVGFALAHGDYRAESGCLVSPHGELIAIADLARPLPHDQLNALAATAMILEAGLLEPEDLAAGLSSFTAPPHRIELVAEIDGIRWINDSKATTPHAALAALSGFDSVILIAGGRNKGVDLAMLAEARDRIRGLVAIGEDGEAILAALSGVRPAQRAMSMADAVDAAAAMAQPGDVVLLSPACASFDWYPRGGYVARGEDFRLQVRQRVARGDLESGTAEGSASPTSPSISTSPSTSTEQGSVARNRDEESRR